MTLKLCPDLEPWNCTRCDKTIYVIQHINKQFYCLDCADIVEEEMENEEYDKENSKVIFLKDKQQD